MKKRKNEWRETGMWKGMESTESWEREGIGKDGKRRKGGEYKKKKHEISGE